MRPPVQGRTWDRWAEAHHQLFKRLLVRRGVVLPEPAPAFRFGMLGELDIPPNVDVSRLEDAVDCAAGHVFYGRYQLARSLLESVVGEYPFIGKLLDTIPAKDV